MTFYLFAAFSVLYQFDLDLKQNTRAASAFELGLTKEGHGFLSCFKVGLKQLYMQFLDPYTDLCMQHATELFKNENLLTLCLLWFCLATSTCGRVPLMPQISQGASSGVMSSFCGFQSEVFYAFQTGLCDISLFSPHKGILILQLH